MEEVWERAFEVGGKEYIAIFHRRPFREGLEVRCKLAHTTLHISEQGYGEIALLEMLRELVAKELQ